MLLNVYDLQLAGHLHVSLFQGVKSRAQVGGLYRLCAASPICRAIILHVYDFSSTTKRLLPHGTGGAFQRISDVVHAHGFGAMSFGTLFLCYPRALSFPLAFGLSISRVVRCQSCAHFIRVSYACRCEGPR